jgi:hypothetical protein
VNVDLKDGPVVVTLSRRNLTQLLQALDTLEPYGSEPYLVRWCQRYANSTDAVFLHVIAQEDEAHYGDRTPGSGLDHVLGADGG